MFGTFRPIRNTIFSVLGVVALAIAAWIAIDYGAAVIVAVGGFALIALAIPILAIYEEEHHLPFNR